MTPYVGTDPAAVAGAYQGRIINHFTDAAGLRGIIGIAGRALYVMQSIVVREARFGFGSNRFLASAPGDIFVTDLPHNASSRQLALIGVSGARGNYVISMGEGELYSQRIRITWTLPSRGIGAIPGGTIVAGPLIVTRRR
ncbi:MAG: hypothetical protein M3Q65_19500 [Chloroflexota bacterium]|nr:hypothetical protein [Chloroflexota bacterium]